MAKQAAKKAAAPKKAPAPAKELILKGTLHIANVTTFEDDRTHLVTGQGYPAGTVVTSDMYDAYEQNRIAIGGTTPIDKFCY